MKGGGESNINLWWRFLYFQKWNCAASLSPKQNYNVVLPISTFMYLWPIYIFPGWQDRSAYFCSQRGRPIMGIHYINHSQTYQCRNWERGRAVSFLLVHQSDFRYSAYKMKGENLLKCWHNKLSQIIFTEYFYHDITVLCEQRAVLSISMFILHFILLCLPGVYVRISVYF